MRRKSRCMDFDRSLVHGVVGKLWRKLTEKYVEKFQKYIFIVVEKIIGSLYKLVE